MLEVKYVIPFITLLIGCLIGNRLALGRDRRKEFNEEGSQLFENLEKQRLSALSGNFSSSANVTDRTAFIQIKRKIAFYKRKGLENAVDKYIQAKEECGYFDKGHYIFDKPDVLIYAIEKIQRYLPYK